MEAGGERTVSISMTVRNAFSERPEMGARKLPAAPAGSPLARDDGVFDGHETYRRLQSQSFQTSRWFSQRRLEAAWDVERRLEQECKISR